MTLIPFIHQLEPDESRKWLKILQEKMPGYRILEVQDCSDDERRKARVAIVANPDPEEVRLLPALEWVHSLWAGVEALLLSLEDHPLKIVRLKDQNLAQVMSEAVLAWVLYLHREMPAYGQQQKQRVWHQIRYRSASQCRVLVLGLGELGLTSVLRLTQNGFEVSGWSRNPKQVPGVKCYAGPEALKEAVKQADILVNLLPLTPQTNGLINKALLSALPKDASLINFGRGATVKTDDLLETLDAGGLKHAVLDVFETEPLPESSPLWNHEEVTVLPHISAPTDYDTASDIVSQNIHDFFQKGIIPECVDKQRGY
ncbi:2-hydroxyacid dehydrogenase [Hahella ganghwensis]|uniref:2-hydroxyacid dehydrogenase n=1 Tax=Hahella ganghwensis TaxID=286420 RepID=UPI00037E1206|nr:glyoxylate/hydroxypyruvate reductase A [Hahella ganghwensis]